MATEEEQEELVRLVNEEEQDNFIKLCGDGDLESVTQLLANNPSLSQAKRQEFPSKLKIVF